MKSQEFKMPAFGVGPIYVITCLILTIAGIWLHLNGYIYQGKIISINIFLLTNFMKQILKKCPQEDQWVREYLI
ncbi:Uncharacterised protein [Finegoldia magna]|uniref:Uncharacterized protein n=1 Tax=Finegoldia magna TaxID=1260 RepID=A0A6N3BYM2_FINMA